jgi:two-component system nitrate/nitrite response regulator NarL
MTRRSSKIAATESIDILLLDDHAMFRQGIAWALEREPDFKVVGQFGSSVDALAALHRSGAAIVLLGVNLGRERALDFVVESRKRGFKGRVLVVTAGLGGPEAVQLIQAGVAGILHKHRSTEELCTAIRQVASGEVYLEREYLTPL